MKSILILSIAITMCASCNNSAKEQERKEVDEIRARTDRAIIADRRRDSMYHAGEDAAKKLMTPKQRRQMEIGDSMVQVEIDSIGRLLHN